MKHLFALSLFIVFGMTATGQNFISNADFASYSVCPTFYSQTANCTDWYQPTGGTSDYFNTCATGTEVHIPQNFAGYQLSGSNAYLGLFTFFTQNGNSSMDYREYIGTTFVPLTIGKKYDITIYASLADSSNAATDGLGILFTTYQLQTTTFDAIPSTPQIDFSSYGPITDKINWVTLTGSFVADSAYTNLSIGNFKPYASLNMVYNTDLPSRYWDTAAYYYIGLIQVADSTGMPGPPDTSKYVFPSAFSPNNDGHNDLFRLIGTGKEKFYNYSLSVYNRWGERVFFTQDVYAGWNGIYNYFYKDIGVYFYIASFTVNGVPKVIKGDVTLIR